MKKFVKSVLLAYLLFMLAPIVVDAAQVHYVAKGESLFTISKNYGARMDDIIKLNYIKNSDLVYEEQVLIIPDTLASNQYKVQPGDSIHSIATKFGISAIHLSSLNNLRNENEINPGQVLSIPSNATAKAVQSEANNTSVDNAVVSSSFTKSVGKMANEYPDVYFNKGKGNGNKIALTFDDGPDPLYTTMVLDVLRKHDVKGTFFLIGDNAYNNPLIVKEMISEGHVIGNHTWSHPNMIKISNEEILSEVEKTEELLHQITGLRTVLIRPPYGSASPRVLQLFREIDYKSILWSVDSEDWRYQSVDRVLLNTLPELKGNDIILFHDSGGEGQSFYGTVEALDRLIFTLKIQGFEFETVDKLLNIPAYK